MPKPTSTNSKHGRRSRGKCSGCGKPIYWRPIKWTPIRKGKTYLFHGGQCMVMFLVRIGAWNKRTKRTVMRQIKKHERMEAITIQTRK